ncbi:MAG TPA: TadE/TadG family type IV pilus assembly protein [Methylovirgula sp.]|jgi:Flp pilus assembly protein TadG
MVASVSSRRTVFGQFAKLALRFWRRREGATAVEFGLIAVPFILIIMATVQTAIVYMAQQELETVTEQASRYILTDQSTNSTQAQFAQTVCNQVSALFNCNNLMINVVNYGTGTNFSTATTTAPTLTYNSNGTVSNTWSFSPGTNGSIVVVQVMYQWPIYLKPFSFNLANLPNGNRLLMATAVFRNEPL